MQWQLISNYVGLGRVRQATLHGRVHLVAPLSLIVPGVLAGSNGPMYYPLDELGKNPTAWNEMPIVVGHPTNNDGSPTSARTPVVAEQRTVGRVYNAKVDGKLIAEAWFDVERLRLVDGRVLTSLEQHRPIEVSTGLFADSVPADTGATYNGKPYSFVARNYQPDHLAILLDQKGACSIEDGCGVLVNKDGQTDKSKQANPAVTKSLKGGLAMDENQRKAIIDGLIANTCCWEEEDREILNELDDAKLTRLQEQAKKDQQREAVLNSATKQFEDSAGAKHTWDGKAWKHEPKKPEPVVNDQDEPEPKSQTTDEWLANAPVEVQNAVRNAVEIEARESAEVIDQLTANLKDGEAKEKVVARLQAMPLVELRELAPLAPKRAEPTANYAGAAGATGARSKRAEEGFAPFGLPDEYIKFDK